MAYYSGSFSSMSNLQAAILANLGTEGYTVNSNTVTLPSAGVVTISSETNALRLRAGDSGQGASDGGVGTIVNASPRAVRMVLHAATDSISFPGAYMMFCFSAPIEVYVVARVNTDYYIWLAFGRSDMPGLAAHGAWVAATGGPSSGGDLSIRALGTPQSHDNACPLIAWQRTTNANARSFAIRDGLESRVWTEGANTGAADAGRHTRPMMNANVQPNAWNTESVLVPITVYSDRASSLESPVLQVRNARYMRVNNYSPEQVISLGSDKWMVFPAYRKNADVHSDNTVVTSAPYHSGTWGWAIRYEGA